MTAPVRIQQRRTNGWRKPEGAVSVARPSRWGNPWRIRRDVALDKQWDIVERTADGEDVAVDHAGSPTRARGVAVDLFLMLLTERPGRVPAPPSYPSLDEIRTELAGRDLMCWCPLDQPCHADVLLELANGGAS